MHMMVKRFASLNFICPVIDTRISENGWVGKLFKVNFRKPYQILTGPALKAKNINSDFLQIDCILFTF